MTTVAIIYLNNLQVQGDLEIIMGKMDQKVMYLILEQANIQVQY